MNNSVRSAMHVASSTTIVFDAEKLVINIIMDRTFLFGNVQHLETIYCWEIPLLIFFLILGPKSIVKYILKFPKNIVYLIPFTIFNFILIYDKLETNISTLNISIMKIKEYNYIISDFTDQRETVFEVDIKHPFIM